MAYKASQPFVLLQTQTATASSSLTFTTGINSTYDNYLLIYKDGTIEGAASLTQGLLVQLSTDTGMTYIATGYVNNTSAGALAVTTGLAIAFTQSVLGTSSFAGSTNLSNLTVSSNVPSSNGTVILFNSTASLTAAAALGGFYNGGAVAVNALKIVMSDASTFSGIFSLYGIAN